MSSKSLIIYTDDLLRKELSTFSIDRLKDISKVMRIRIKGESKTPDLINEIIKKRKIKVDELRDVLENLLHFLPSGILSCEKFHPDTFEWDGREREDLERDLLVLSKDPLFKEINKTFDPSSFICELSVRSITNLLKDLSEYVKRKESVYLLNKTDRKKILKMKLKRYVRSFKKKTSEEMKKDIENQFNWKEYFSEFKRITGKDVLSFLCVSSDLPPPISKRIFGQLERFFLENLSSLNFIDRLKFFKDLDEKISSHKKCVIWNRLDKIKDKFIIGCHEFNLNLGFSSEIPDEEEYGKILKSLKKDIEKLYNVVYNLLGEYDV